MLRLYNLGPSYWVTTTNTAVPRMRMSSYTSFFVTDTSLKIPQQAAQLGYNWLANRVQCFHEQTQHNLGPSPLEPAQYIYSRREAHLFTFHFPPRVRNRWAKEYFTFWFACCPFSLYKTRRTFPPST